MKTDDHASRHAAAPAASPAQIPPQRPGRTRLFVTQWLPVLLWMALMFGISTDAGSSRRTSRIIGPILRWFHPGVTDETISRVQLVVRKGAHFTEYAILALLSWRALRGSRRPDASGRPDAPGRHQAGRVLATGPPSTPPSSSPPASAWPLPWRQREALLAFAIAVVFALTDEWHQTTVPSRQGQFSDVLIDATGAAGGLAVLWWLGRRRRRW